MNKFKISVAVSWIISYVISFSIPFIIFAILYQNASTLIKKEIDTSNLLMLSKTQMEIDQRLSQTNRIFDEIKYDASLSYAQLYYGQPDGTQINSMRTVMNNLDIWTKAYSYIEQSIIYLGNGNLVISNTSISSDLSFYYAYFAGTGISFDEWNKKMTLKSDGEFILAKKEDKAGYIKDFIVFIKTIPTNLMLESQNNLIVFLDKNYINSEISKLDASMAVTTALIKADNEILACNGYPDQYKGIIYDINLTASNYLRKNQLVTYIKSGINDLYYVSIMDTDVYFYKLNNFRLAGLICFLLSLCLLVVSSYILLKINYTPLKKIISIFRDRSDQGVYSGFLEYNTIVNAVKSITNEKSQLQGTAQKYQTYLLQKSLRDLLLQKGNSQAIIEQLKISFDISLEKEYFCLVLFDIHEIGRIFFEDFQKNEEKVIELIAFMINNLAIDLAGNSVFVTYTIINGKPVIIFNMDKDMDRPFLVGVLKGILEVLHEVFEIKMNVYASNLVKSDLYEAYEKVEELSLYKEFAGNSETISFVENEVSKPESIYFSIEKEFILLNAINKGEKEKAQALLSDYLSSRENITSLEYIVLRQNISSALYRALHAALKAGTSDQQYDDYIKRMDNLYRCKTYEQFKGEVLKRVNEICDIVISTDKSFSEKVIDYIKINYRDQDMNVSSLADYMNISISYLSKRFKQERQVNLLQYINEFRMNQAKILIMQNELSIENIAHQVGYQNYRTFARVFMDINGLSPSEFKHNQAEKKHGQ